MRVGITGANGFIGNHLVRFLVEQKGQRPIAFLQPGSDARPLAELRGQYDEIWGDLLDRDSLDPLVGACDAVIHLAGVNRYWAEDVSVLRRVNVDGARNVADACRAHKIAKLVHASSCITLGASDAPVARNEDSEFNRAGLDFPYAATKKAGEEEMKMFLIGKGRGTCHPCYIENLLDALELAAEHPRAPGRAYIAGDGETISFAEYFNHLARIAGERPVRRSIPLSIARAMASAFEATARLRGSQARPLLTQTAIDMITTQSRLSTQRIGDELGFTPRFSLAAAMDDLGRWFRRDAKL